MRKTKVISVSSERTVLLSTTCDICGETSNGPDWSSDTYDATKSTVKLREGESYPEGGSGTDLEIDVCPNCFKHKLIPWVESFGVTKVSPDEWDW